MAFFQAPPRLQNQFTDDPLLIQYLQRWMPTDTMARITPELTEMGELAADEMWTLSLRHRNDEPTHQPYDAWGKRIDEVCVNAAWERYAEIAAEKGLVGLAYEQQDGALSRLHQFSMVYLFDRSSQVYSCPLAMTDGCARTLKELAQSDLKNDILPHLVSRDPGEAWTSGQWMTERTGGSDVGLSETVAKQVDGQWRLWGTKWFTSAVTSQVALTLARPEENGPGGRGLALFCVYLRDESGNLQNIRVNRLKEKLGTRNLPTAELELDGTPAIPVAELKNGVFNMRFMLNTTRTWNSVCAVAALRRGLTLARDYAKKRVAFGAPLSEKPLHLDTLSGVAAEYEAAFHLAFFAVRLLGRDEAGELSEAEAGLLRSLLPLVKLLTAKQAVRGMSELIECFGGAGYVEDTGLPELLRDSQVLSIWEGTTNVLALETMRAMQRTGSLPTIVGLVGDLGKGLSLDPLRVLANEAQQSITRCAQWAARCADENPEDLERQARDFAMGVGRALSLALLTEHAQWAAERGDKTGIAAAQRFFSHGLDNLACEKPKGEAMRRLAMGERA